MNADPGSRPAPAPAAGTPSAAEAACEQALRMLSEAVPLAAVLAHLAACAERLSPGTTASILMLDEQGLLRNGASPNLPADYLRAIDRLAPDPRVGTCAAAAATGEVVFTPDFCADEKWAELRHLPLSLGYVGAWSMPIKSESGKVLGTFGTYFRERRGPTDEEYRAVATLASAAALALQTAK